MRNEMVVVGDSRPRLSWYLEQGDVAEHIQCHMGVGIDK